jgi:hypothetical protein
VLSSLLKVFWLLLYFVLCSIQMNSRLLYNATYIQRIDYSHMNFKFLTEHLI